ncbi:MAG TPA: helix-turn-helix domain-containing protein [Armatimonadota bacterium]|nr:helix-turn-helix domain-containing protein [Armatimonadota bacterium]
MRAGKVIEGRLLREKGSRGEFLLENYRTGGIHHVVNPLLTVAEAAKLLKTSEYQVRELARSGELRGAKWGGAWRFSLTDLEAFYLAHRRSGENNELVAQGRERADDILRRVREHPPSS